MKQNKLSRIVMLLVAGLAAGCAALPKEQPAPKVVSPSLNSTVDGLVKSGAFPEGNWPATDWWKAFNNDELTRLIELSLKNNPSLTIAEARLRQASQNEKLAGLEGDIHYSTDASLVREHLSGNGIFPPPLGGSTYNQGEVSQSVSYTLDWWHKNRSLLQAAIGETRSAEAEAEAARLLISAEVADAYLGLWDATARSSLVKEAIEKRKALMELAKLRKEKGLENAIPLHRLSIEEAADQDTLKTLEYAAQSNRYRLAALTGNGPDWVEQNPLTPSFEGKEFFPLPKQMPLDWVARRPDLVAQRWRVEAAAKRIDVAKADFYPNVDLNLLVGLQSIELGKWLNWDSRFGSFGPAVHLPIFNGNTLRAKLGVRQDELAEAVGDYNKMVVEAAREVADSLTLLKAVGERRDLEKRAEKNSAQTLKLEKERFKAGLTDITPQLDAELNNIELREKLSRLETERWRALIALTQSLGGGYNTAATKE